MTACITGLHFDREIRNNVSRILMLPLEKLFLVSNAGKQLKLSLQIPQPYSNFGNSVNDGKNVLMFQDLGSSTGGARHCHVMKATTPIPDNETSPLLTPGGRTVLESASLASYVRAFSWNRSASVPVTPVSTRFVLYLLPYIIFFIIW